LPLTEIWTPQGTVAVGSSPIEVVERPTPDLATTTTADPGTSGTSLAVTNRSLFPQASNFKIYVVGTSGIAEIMLVTAGHGTGAGSFTVTRGQEGTTGVAHSVGARVSLLGGVQRVEPVDASRILTFRGRCSTFRTPGRAGTTGQKIFAIHNATASTVLVDLHRVRVDLIQTAIKLNTTLPPIVRTWKFTAVPTNGTVLTKGSEDSAYTSNSAVTCWGDASADGTGSGTALTITLPAGTVMEQIFAPRYMAPTSPTATPTVELVDAVTFFEGYDEFITLRALEGVAVFLDYTVALANPTTDSWIVNASWDEYRPA
jgi:hypothetical protein